MTNSTNSTDTTDTVEIELNADLDILIQIKKLMRQTRAPSDYAINAGIPLHGLMAIVNQLVPTDQVLPTIKRLEDEHLIIKVEQPKGSALSFYALSPAVERGFIMARLFTLELMKDD